MRILHHRRHRSRTEFAHARRRIVVVRLMAMIGSSVIAIVHNSATSLCNRTTCVCNITTTCCRKCAFCLSIFTVHGQRTPVAGYAHAVTILMLQSNVQIAQLISHQSRNPNTHQRVCLVYRIGAVFVILRVISCVARNSVSCAY